jgi:hypothetical protein
MKIILAALAAFIATSAFAAPPKNPSPPVLVAPGQHEEGDIYFGTRRIGMDPDQSVRFYIQRDWPPSSR